MKNDRSIDLGLTGYEELFMSTEERLDAKKPKVEAIPLADLIPFRNHPFQVKEDEEMAAAHAEYCRCRRTLSGGGSILWDQNATFINRATQHRITASGT